MEYRIRHTLEGSYPEYYKNNIWHAVPGGTKYILISDAEGAIDSNHYKLTFKETITEYVPGDK